MRKIVLAALTGTAMTLAACSETAEDTAAPAGESAAEVEDTAADTTAAVIDANTATAAQLAGVEGISPELAEAIVAGQPYADVTGLHARLLENVSQEEASAILVKVFVPIDLNNASEEAIALVPGMTDRMIHEFEEYRPYEDMAEFDREIGKYVDAEEVARFRNYVTL
ncbi:helix-hairpin-helix domain-containing protein [Pelagerythrobacter marensis]|uniref:Helix-hairpin-helix domain-containing protein n=1 Tax=Pelagerythrobacter marensis TaxID=543877 RepID=A0ABZ2D897_9SPHN